MKLLHVAVSIGEEYEVPEGWIFFNKISELSQSDGKIHFTLMKKEEGEVTTENEKKKKPRPTEVKSKAIFENMKKMGNPVILIDDEGAHLQTANL